MIVFPKKNHWRVLRVGKFRMHVILSKAFEWLRALIPFTLLVVLVLNWCLAGQLAVGLWRRA